jgi:hypothetical protein
MSAVEISPGRVQPTGPVPAGPLVLSAAALAGLGVAGYLGGELAYHYGVRVADEKTQASGYHATLDTLEEKR